MVKFLNRNIKNAILLFFYFSLYIKETDGWKKKKELCVCDFTGKLNEAAEERKYKTCTLNPSHGDQIRIIGNSDYVFECFKKSKIYCPSHNKHIFNADISNYSKHLTYTIDNDVINGMPVSVYNLFIDTDASDLLFYCYIKPAQISEFLRGTVKIDLKRETKEEYSKIKNEKSDICNFAEGNLNIGPTMGNYENLRTVNCIHKVQVNKLFIIKLPKIDSVTDNFVPQFLSCISKYPFINFTVNNIVQGDEDFDINVIFGKVNKIFNITCTFDLSEYKQEPCSIGRKGNVVLLFSPEQTKESAADKLEEQKETQSQEDIKSDADIDAPSETHNKAEDTTPDTNPPKQN